MPLATYKTVVDTPADRLWDLMLFLSCLGLLLAGGFGVYKQLFA